MEVLGKWVPLREYATEKEPILMLKVTADTPEKLEAALRKLDEIMGLAEKIQKLTMSTMSLGDFYYYIVRILTCRYSIKVIGNNNKKGGRFIDGRLEVGIDDTPGFNLRGKIVGPNGSYLKHVTSESGVRVQLKGRGSGFVEGDGKESDMQMYMHLTAQSNEEVNYTFVIVINYILDCKRKEIMRRLDQECASGTRCLYGTKEVLSFTDNNDLVER